MRERSRKCAQKPGFARCARCHLRIPLIISTRLHPDSKERQHPSGLCLSKTSIVMDWSSSRRCFWAMGRNWSRRTAANGPAPVCGHCCFVYQRRVGTPAIAESSSTRSRSFSDRTEILLPSAKRAGGRRSAHLCQTRRVAQKPNSPSISAKNSKSNRRRPNPFMSKTVPRTRTQKTTAHSDPTFLVPFLSCGSPKTTAAWLRANDAPLRNTGRLETNLCSKSYKECY